MKRMSIRIPATSGNLGPGFDALALAFQLYCRITIEVDEENISGGPHVELSGRYCQGLPKDSNNLILKVIEANIGPDKSILAHTKLKVENDIPLARGLGSSSAAACGAFWCARWLCDLIPGRDETIQFVAQLEGHGENAAASVLGGFVVVAKAKGDNYACVSSAWPSRWSTLVVVPDYEVSTPAARKILPRTAGLNEVVRNIQNTALLVSAIDRDDELLLSLSLKDFIHEPYREALVSELSSLRATLRRSPSLGVVLSGAGSSVLVIVDQSYKDDVLEKIYSWQTKNSPGSKVFDLEVDRRGLVEEDG